MHSLSEAFFKGRPNLKRARTFIEWTHETGQENTAGGISVLWPVSPAGVEPLAVQISPGAAGPLVVRPGSPSAEPTPFDPYEAVPTTVVTVEAVGRPGRPSHFRSRFIKAAGMLSVLGMAVLGGITIGLRAEPQNGLVEAKAEARPAPMRPAEAAQPIAAPEKNQSSAPQTGAADTVTGASAENASDSLAALVPPPFGGHLPGAQAAQEAAEAANAALTPTAPTVLAAASPAMNKIGAVRETAAPASYILNPDNTIAATKAPALQRISLKPVIHQPAQQVAQALPEPPTVDPSYRPDAAGDAADDGGMTADERLVAAASVPAASVPAASSGKVTDNSEVLYEGEPSGGWSHEPAPVSIETAAQPVRSNARRAAAASSDAEASASPKRLRVEGIFYDQTRPLALINGAIAEIGGHVGAAEVVDIKPGAVTVRVNGQQQVLHP